MKVSFKSISMFLNSSVGMIWILFVIFNAFIIFTLIWPSNIITIDEPFKVLTKKVSPGGFVQYQLHFCKRYALHGTVVVQMVNSHSITLETFPSNVEKSCYKKDYIGTRKIPEYTAPGFYKIRWTAIYHPWPWVEKSYVFMSEPFEIVR